MPSTVTRSLRGPSDVAQPATMSPLARVLFTDTRLAAFWLLARLALGYEWLVAGWEKLTGQMLPGAAVPSSAWVFTAHDGDAMRQFVTFALMNAPGGKLAGQYPQVQSWYAAFLQHVVLPNAVVFTYLITFGELLVGLGLIVGAMTGIAAGFGVLMNLNYLLAGSISINPILLLLGMSLILARRVAGRYGVDGAVAVLWPVRRSRHPRLTPGEQSDNQPTERDI